MLPIDFKILINTETLVCDFQSMIIYNTCIFPLIVLINVMKVYVCLYSSFHWKKK